MKLLAVTVSYRTVPIAELERASVSSAALGRALPCLLRAPDVLEALILSTCNRTEIYAWVKDPEEALEQIRLYLEDLQGLPPGWTERRCKVLVGEEAIRHLFVVTAGLDSMVQGEAEIQGQVKDAYKAAAALGAVGPHLHALFRCALEAGKKARTSTGLSRVAHSLPRAAVRAIDAVLGELSGREVLVVGSGQVAAGSLRALSAAGARAGVAARRLGAAESLADRLGAFALPIEAVEDALVAVDAAIFATAAPQPLIGRTALGRALAARGGAPLVVVDLGLPRNVDPKAAELDSGKLGFTLYDLERLDREGFTVPGGREPQLERAMEIALAEAERCVAWFRSRPADAVAAALQAHAARIAAAEAELAANRIPGLDERQRAAVELAIRKGVRKIVHVPTVRAKEACSRGDQALVDAAWWLFGLEGGAPSDHALPKEGPG